MSSTLESEPTTTSGAKPAFHRVAAVGVLLSAFLLVVALGTHAEFLQSAGLVPTGADNWFSSLNTAVKNADGEMTLAAIATAPIAASVIGWSHYAGGQQSHKHAGRVLVGLVVLLAVAPHIAS
jgi:hypothetical protein